MATRTDEDMVKAVLLSDYGPMSNGELPSLLPFIRAANLMTNRAYTCSVSNGMTLSDEELVEIETWLSAHFYVCSDQVAQSRSEAGASMSFGGQLGEGLMSSKYGQMALTLDISTCLKKLGKRAIGAWLGTAANAQLTWEQRNGETR